MAKYYPGLVGTVKCCLAVFAAMAIGKRTKPLCVIFEAPSGFGKTAALQMFFPIRDDGLNQYAYRSDKFTPKSFVSHAANVSQKKLKDLDLLPRLENKVLVTKELAPILRGRREELTENFSILISVLDGKGFTSDSGMRGRRGYQRPILFNWIGATTPLPRSTHRLMAQLGTRLLFYEPPTFEPTEAELSTYAKRDDAGPAEVECQTEVNDFLLDFFRLHSVGAISPEDIVIPERLSVEIVRWASFVANGRREIWSDREDNWVPVAALPAESPFKLIDYFKLLARGHALVHARSDVTISDLDLISHVAVSSIPGHLRPLVRRLRSADDVQTSQCMALCGVSDTSARYYMKELKLLGIADLDPGNPANNTPSRITLADACSWMRLNLER